MFVRSIKYYRNMKTIIVVLTTLLVAFTLTVSAADESKDHEEDKRMIYWKRGVIADLENDDFDEESRFAPRPGYRNRFERPSYLRKKMIYW
ncbi:unnamed protein product [Hymenolepis diminuta]|uniref:Uncharacterized protein n=1 Tax=Hymenolepis diminuta TaxID=6216 RepID=A0A564YJJ4_HYMDI|nr:unnamed protein product [Hymenolepis diminuta]